MSYPESVMNVAVDFGNGLVKVYGHEDHGFRPLVREIKFDRHSQSLYYCMTHNADQRRAHGLTL